MLLLAACFVLAAAAPGAHALQWQCSASSNCTWSLPRLPATALGTTIELMTRRALELHHAPGDTAPRLFAVVLLQRWQEDSRAFEAAALAAALAFPSVTFVRVTDAQHSVFGALYSIRGFPSLVLFRDGLFVGRLDGLADRDGDRAVEDFVAAHTGLQAGAQYELDPACRFALPMPPSPTVHERDWGLVAALAALAVEAVYLGWRRTR